jgi:hypothetical protein
MDLQHSFILSHISEISSAVKLTINFLELYQAADVNRQTTAVVGILL